ncbi:MAG: hypothetical protein JXO51_12010 [Candidatus Aminicenantes bacterium]|nr:hypothetical protein [Candidatus Aminicenantes bacterium]
MALPPAAVFLGWLLAPFLLQAGILPVGRIIDPVVCLRDADHSYALYLPPGYTAERAWPVLYCLDPGGRGQAPVALFREAAERFGWILVGSNNLRNGPWGEILAAARAFWSDTRARLAIDDSRVYAAGFSGGARAACGLGRLLSIRLAGVIGCGAGLPEWLEPADLSGVPWFGTVGLRDFNYGEMQELDFWLRRLGTPARLRIFHGEHRWPPPAVALEAVAWLEERSRPAADQGGR